MGERSPSKRPPYARLCRCFSRQAMPEAPSFMTGGLTRACNFWPSPTRSEKSRKNCALCSTPRRRPEAAAHAEKKRRSQLEALQARRKGASRRLTPQSRLAQQLEGVRRPVAFTDAGDAPQHAQRFDRARRLDRAHVLGVPAELITDFGDGLFRVCVGAADEHRRPSAGEMRIDHLRIADRI